MSTDELDFMYDLVAEITADRRLSKSPRQGDQLRVWDSALSLDDPYRLDGSVPESATAAALAELAQIRPILIRDGVIDLGAGIYPEKSFDLLSGGDPDMKYIGVDDFSGLKTSLSLLFDPVVGSTNGFIWPRQAGVRPVNAAMVRADMVEFAYTLLNERKEPIHFFINGQDDFIHNDGYHTPAETIEVFENYAQPGSEILGFAYKGGILPSMRGNPAFELRTHIKAGYGDNGFFFFRKR
jgi:hypothetical protein